MAAQETEEGRAWAEAKVKALTGYDPITARFMRQDFFAFTPTFKLFIAGNHKPGFRGVDEGHPATGVLTSGRGRGGSVSWPGCSA